MNLNDQHDFIKLTRRIESLEAKVYGGPPETTDPTKVAVHAPKKWMKEKVAKVWGIKDDFIYHKYCGDFIHIVDDGNNNKIVGFNNEGVAKEAGYKIISFQDFCKDHGISDKPDYRKHNGKVYKVAEHSSCGYHLIWKEDGRMWTVTNTDSEPATEKEYLDQEHEDFPDTWDKVYEKEPELKLHEEWDNEYPEGMYQEDYKEGAKDMAKAIYDRALEIFKRKCRHNNGDTGMKGIKEQIWKEAKQDSFDEAMNGSLKPPQ